MAVRLAGRALKDLFVTLFGKPEGIVLFQLIEATQYTIYLSLIAFLGGGFVGALITLLRVSPSSARGSPLRRR